MSLDDDLRIGARAAQLLGDEVLTLAFANIERDQLEAWRKSQVRDTEARECIWHMIRQMDAVKAELSRLAGNAKMVQSKADDLNRRRDQMKRAKEQVAAHLGVDPKLIPDD